jgi:DNA-binding PadR family transcriptional regulator
VDRAESERRRYYELTPTGRTAANAELDRLELLLRRVRRGFAGEAPA